MFIILLSIKAATAQMTVKKPSFLYYQMTTRWFQLMAMAGAEGAKEASGAMDDSKESTDAIRNTAKNKPLK
jgi:hypothetical protein